ncbi:hypothetical protein C5167_005119 [Papaver somniferum]|uniref:Glycine-rich protein n=1 Tax=Papaver somniferum TaxID=3469 RepID=A0A4Y7JD44_PAPSO|nr:keratin, type I cytoskeletal 10-like [Papaver somniferum]RZC57821.1 hypothetical protein C5167_005119 [Papaver somniferum]
MDRGRGGRGGGRDDFFGGGFGGGFGSDPFAGMGGFGGDPFAGMGGFGGFGRHQSLMSSFFGGRDPFDSPFFNRPFSGGGGGNSMFGPSMFGQSMFGESMIGPSMFGSNGGGLSRDAPASGFIQNVPVQENKQGGGLVIQEINSDAEEEEAKQEVDEQKENPRKHSRSSKEAFVEDPDDAAEERKNKLLQYRNGHSSVERTQPQTKSFSYQSSTVTYGGVNGAYYTSSSSRKMGGDGVVVEESKEADTTTGKASHRLSRGIHNKGHSVTRKLNPDGKVDTLQTLHNLDEGELPVFEEAWNGSARRHLPGWDEQGFNMQGYNGQRTNRGQAAPSQGWALPSTEQPQRNNPEETESRARGSSSRGQN